MTDKNISKQKLLLHICCAVCGGPVLERLMADYEIILYYFNPNIFPREEYEKRGKYVQLIADNLKLPVIIGDYDHDSWLDRVKGLESEPEKGERCSVCFRVRFEAVAQLAKEQGIELFSTTLTISPWKNSIQINEVGVDVAREVEITYMERNDKKQDGYKRAVELAQESGIYQQNYCGCEFSARSARVESQKS